MRLVWENYCSQQRMGVQESHPISIAKSATDQSEQIDVRTRTQTHNKIYSTQLWWPHGKTTYDGVVNMYVLQQRTIIISGAQGNTATNECNCLFRSGPRRR